MNTTTTLELKEGATLPAVIGTLLPARRNDGPVSDMPKTVLVAKPQVEAVERLSLSIEGYAPLTVTERRTLTPEEIQELSEEREALDALEKYLKARKDAHRSMVFNHFDVVIESEIEPEVIDTFDVDSKGHYITADSAFRPDGGKKFVRQLSEGAPTLDMDALIEAAADDDHPFTHEDYLAMTTPVRVLDEAKAMIHMRKRPTEVMEGLKAAAVPGSKSASLYHR